MFNFFKKKVATVSKIQNKDLMEAIVAAAVLVAYADGDCSDEELAKLDGIVSNNDNLKHFGEELGRTIDKYSNLYESGKRIANMKLMKEIRDVTGNEEQKLEVFIIAIEIADADGNIDEDEVAVLNKIGKALGLKLEDYM